MTYIPVGSSSVYPEHAGATGNTGISIISTLPAARARLACSNSRKCAPLGVARTPHSPNAVIHQSGLLRSAFPSQIFGKCDHAITIDEQSTVDSFRGKETRSLHEITFFSLKKLEYGTSLLFLGPIYFFSSCAKLERERCWTYDSYIGLLLAASCSLSESPVVDGQWSHYSDIALGSAPRRV